MTTPGPTASGSAGRPTDRRTTRSGHGSPRLSALAAGDQRTTHSAPTLGRRCVRTRPSEELENRRRRDEADASAPVASGRGRMGRLDDVLLLDDEADALSALLHDLGTSPAMGVVTASARLRKWRISTSVPRDLTPCPGRGYAARPLPRLVPGRRLGPGVNAPMPRQAIVSCGSPTAGTGCRLRPRGWPGS
jgi:hypothetical protein